MSNEILSESKTEDRIRSFWTVLRHAGPVGSSEDAIEVAAGVAALIFSHAYADNFSVQRMVNLSIAAATSFEADFDEFCQIHGCGPELKSIFEKSIFDCLRKGNAYAAPSVHPFGLLSEVTKGLSNKQVKYLASQILDQSFVPRRYYPGSFPASREIAQLMLNLTESMDSPNSDIFIPYVPYPGMPGLAGNARITCCVPNPTDAAIMAVYQLVEGGSADVQIMMPEREPGIFTRHQRFSRIIATPPGRGLRSHWSGQTDGETLCVDQIVQNLMGVQGRAAICVSPGLLFQSSRGKVLLRRNLIQRGLVEAVIMLPGGLHRSTYKASAILVLRSGKHANGKIKVINASDCKIGEERRPVLDVEKLLNRVYSTDDGEKARTVTENELVECDYDLTPARYLAPTQVLTGKLIQALIMHYLKNQNMPLGLLHGAIALITLL